ncbi:36785_t:CDS:1, partial [Gigaspora margarita]
RTTKTVTTVADQIIQTTKSITHDTNNEINTDDTNDNPPIKVINTSEIYYQQRNLLSAMKFTINDNNIAKETRQDKTY